MLNVVLLKATPDDASIQDKYATAIKETFGARLWILPVLQFVFEDANVLANLLADDTVPYEGVILTSPRSAEAIHQAFQLARANDSLEPAFQLWRETKRCYAVGEATLSYATNILGFRTVLGSDSGNAEKLSSQIIADYKDHGDKVKFLFPCGNLKRDILPDKLSSAGIDLKIVEAYKTQPSSALEKSIEDLAAEIQELDYVIFFSPSGVKFSWTIFEKFFSGFESTCKFVSIGPATTQALEAKGCRKIFTSACPNVAGLIDAFKLALEN